MILNKSRLLPPIVLQANATATGINTEERLLGWAATKFPQLATFTSQLTPLVELWGLAVGFFDTQLAWLNAPLPTPELRHHWPGGHILR